MRPSGRLRAMPFFRSLVETLTTHSLSAWVARYSTGYPPRSRSLSGGRAGRLDDQVLRELGEGHRAVGRDDQRVLDPHAADAREIDAGLDRHHVTRPEGTSRRPR